MTTNQDRENILMGMRALKSLCFKVDRESVHVQSLDWKDRKIMIAWRLVFDSENLTFEPSVQAIPDSCSSGSRTEVDFQSLNKRIENRLLHLKEYEPWPSVIPEDWLIDEAPG